jgi:hypothetical protein
LFVLAVLTALTGARTRVVWFKICPVLLSSSAVLLARRVPRLCLTSGFAGSFDELAGQFARGQRRLTCWHNAGLLLACPSG